MKFAVMRLTLCSLLVVLAACSGIGIDSKKIDYKSSSAILCQKNRFSCLAIFENFIIISQIRYW